MVLKRTLPTDLGGGGAISSSMECDVTIDLATGTPSSTTTAPAALHHQKFSELAATTLTPHEG